MRKAGWILGGLVSFIVAFVISGIGGCNIHELGHLEGVEKQRMPRLVRHIPPGMGNVPRPEAGFFNTLLVTGKIAGVPIDDITWCTPANGRIAFAYQEPASVGYAGGFTAALVLLAIYLAVIRPRLESFYWWMAGVAVLGTAISHLIVGVIEGSDPIRYSEFQDSEFGLVLLVAVPLVVAVAIQLMIQRPAGLRTKRSEKTNAL